jgi:ribA/ribD-fused uncharacterized protein
MQIPRYDLEMLRSAVASGARFTFLFFWGHTTRGKEVQQECFSQWYESPFAVDGESFATAEHYMMYRKALLFGDDETAQRVLRANIPGEAKALGRSVRGFDEAVWQRHRIDIVIAGNTAKFSQAAHLRSFLLSTQDRVLVEASPVDRIWGIGLAPDHRDIQDPSRWRGLNLLGFALMDVREALRESSGP